MNTTKETPRIMNTQDKQNTPESTHAQVTFVNFSEDYSDASEETVTFEMPKLPNWDLADMIGYTPNTTFWDDFSIADIFGVEAIIDTFERAFTEWRSDVEYIAELALVLNHKGLYYSESRPILSNTYFALWQRLHSWAQDYYTGEDADYYFNVTD